MPRVGKAKSGLAPIKDIIRSLELNEQEGPRFKALTLDFLTKTKKLQVNEIIDTSDGAIYRLARELLETETTRGEGPTGSQYWPFDDTFRKALTYAANPSRIIKLVSYIMRNQRKNLLSARNKRRRQNPSIVKNHEPEIDLGASSTAGAILQTDLECAVEEREAVREASAESLPSFTEILGAPRETPAATYPSDSTNPSSHLATPPVTPAASSSMRRRPTFYDDSPHPSVEMANTTAAAAQNFPPQQPLQSTTELRNREREKSPTAFAAYNPRLPTHRDGTLDIASVKAWRGGIEFVKASLNDFNWSLVKARQEHILAGDHDTASALEQQSLGLGKFLDHLGNEEKKQEKRLDVFTASREARAGASGERGITRTLSPSAQ